MRKVQLNLKGVTDKTFLMAVAAVATFAADSYVARRLSFADLQNAINAYAATHPKGNSEANMYFDSAMETYVLGDHPAVMVFMIHDICLKYAKI